MIELNSKQRKTLEKLAHSLEPLVIVGGAGVTENLKSKVLECLNAHELVKVKFNEYQDQKHELTQEIVDFTGATLVRIIGNIAILYRESDIPEKRKIKIKK